MKFWSRVWNLFVYAFKNSFKVEGRACRMEAGAFTIVNLLISLVFILLLTFSAIALAPSVAQNEFNPGLSFFIFVVYALFSIISLCLFPAALTLWVRRFHDINMSGWLLLPLFLLECIPFVGIVVFGFLIYFYLIKQGDEGENKYGLPSVNF